MEGAQIPKRNSQKTYTHIHRPRPTHTHRDTHAPRKSFVHSKFAPETHLNGKTIPIKIYDDVMCNLE